MLLVLVGVIKFWLKSDKNNGRFAEKPKCVFGSISRCLLFHLREHIGFAMGAKPSPYCSLIPHKFTKKNDNHNLIIENYNDFLISTVK
jgi:hypothetical protein